MAPMHRRMLAPISAIKHYVHQPNTGVAPGAIVVSTVATAVAKGAARATTATVEEGAVIKAIHLEYWLIGTAATTVAQFAFIVYKLPSGQTEPTAVNMQNLGSWENKKNILFSSQGILGELGSAQAIPVMRDWIKVPKGKQRFGLGDKFQVCTFGVADIRVCGLATYKEYE